MLNLLTYIVSRLDNKHYCRTCGKRYEGQKDKNKCIFCSKYYCKAHLSTVMHSQSCFEKEVKEHNKQFCHYCNKKYANWTDIHDCSVCGYLFCSNHWVPESHGCHKKSRPPGGLREVYHADGRIDAYGK